MSESKTVVVLPVYNNEKSVESVLRSLLEIGLDIFIVDDGSTDKTPSIIRKYSNDVTVLSHNQNRGKGAALLTAFTAALAQGYSHAITIDADGQHRADEIPRFLEASQKHPNAVIIGNRDMSASDVPERSTFGRTFSNFWFWVDTGKKHPDTQSGFRLYPLDIFKKNHFFSSKYEFEIEVIVRASWQGIPILAIPVSVRYEPPEKRVSHFRPFGDNLRISLLNTVLFLIAFIWIKPRDFFLTIRKKGIKRFLLDQLDTTKHTPFSIAFSVAIGLFFAFSPFWGYQGALATATAWMFRANPLIAFMFSNASVPPIIPFIIYAEYKFGHFLTGTAGTLETVSFEAVTKDLFSFVAGSITLSFAIALLAFVATLLPLAYRGKQELPKQ